MTIRPEDILADGADTTIINGKVLRKGTVAAFLANIDLLENEHTSEQQKHEALKLLEELAPAIITLGLHHHVIFKNKHVEQLLVDTQRKHCK